jgi:NAD(P)-dependent dehydrogenase (short-subunit alcohol dehydrogenase family)
VEELQMSERFSLAGKSALITGGSRGLGHAMALAFAEAGADVAIVSRKLDACEATVREIEARGVRGFAHACHIGRWDEIEPMADAVWDCARQGRHPGQQRRHVAALPVAGRGHRARVRQRDRGQLQGPVPADGSCSASGCTPATGGSVINISSTASLGASPWALPYAGAKAAINVLTQGFSAAFSPNVRVNTIVVGPFATDVAEHWADPPDHDHPGWTKAGLRVGQPDEIVGLALYLASDASTFTNAATIRVDGGPVRASRGDTESSPRP